MAGQERKIPAPEANPETRPFWEAATAGRLLIGKCKSCGKPHYYPRAICPLCGSDATEWVPASGRGAVYSYSVMRRVPVPYALAYVTLEEGVHHDDQHRRLRPRRHPYRTAGPCELQADEGGPPVPMFTPE